MDNLFQVLVNAIKAKIIPLVTKLRYFTSLTFWKTIIFSKIRVFLTKLFDVRPKDKNDYYTVGGWLVSKRLAFALVVGIGIISLVYLWLIRGSFGFLGNKEGIKTYKYSSIMLRMETGQVRIKGKSGYIAYVGAVKKGYCSGTGTLYDPSKNIVYKGNFDKSMYEGLGTLYYPTGVVNYSGNFHENLYSGEGKLYWENSNLEYDGQFLDGMKDGDGKLHDYAGNLVYTGAFSRDQLVYSNIVGKSNTEMAEIYKGKSTVYSSADKYIVHMKDINAYYELPADPDTLEDESNVDKVYVMNNKIILGDKICTNAEQLETVFGQPSYQGESRVTLPEALAINHLNDESPVYSGKVSMELTRTYDDYYTVSNFDRSYIVYLYTYEKDGLIYTFLTRDPLGNGFDLYFISQSQTAEGGGATGETSTEQTGN
ncbi:MAG: hypothetical protein K6F00_11590 [Lachnospiraceae bacterium]|nr:hypothetical protein [Lachnospiraceae bacterium]